MRMCLGNVNTQNRLALRAIINSRCRSPLADAPARVVAKLLITNILLIIYKEEVQNLDEFTSIRTYAL